MRFSVLRHRIWQFIRNSKRDEFTIWQIRRALECPYSTIRAYVGFLLKNEYLEIAQDLRQNGKGEFSYRLCKNTGPCAPIARDDGTLYDPNLSGRIEIGQQRMWNALRLANGCLTREELIVRAEVSGHYASKYLQALERYGYLRVESRPKTYFLVRDTGPYHPAWQTPKLFDQNLGKYVEIESDS